MAEFEIGKHRYRTGIMSSRKQFHCARRLAGVLTKFLNLINVMGPGREKAEPTAEEGRQFSAEELEALEQFGSAIAEMKDEDADYVIDSCLEVASRKDEVGYAPIWNRQAQRLMFDDIDLRVMVVITFKTLQENIGSFLGDGAQTIGAQFPM